MIESFMNEMKKMYKFYNPYVKKETIYTINKNDLIKFFKDCWDASGNYNLHEESEYEYPNFNEWQ